MSLFSKSLFLLAWLQLIHSGFSSYEFHRVSKQLVLDNPDAVLPKLPLDIKLEAISGLVFFILAEFIGNSVLRFLTIRGEERIIDTHEYLKPVSMNKASNINVLLNSDPYGEINYHPSFVDIQAKRKEMKEFLAAKG